MLRAKIGKLLTLLLCFTLSADATQIALRVVSEGGQPIRTIAIGAPCMVEVIVPGSVAMQKRPVVDGIDRQNIVREQESLQMHMANGVTIQERTIGYLVSFPTAGTIKIGPARVQTSHGELVSPVITLEVQEPSARQQQDNMVFAQLLLKKRSAFVQEGIPYTVRFYYTANSVNRLNMQPLSVPDCTVVPSDEVLKDTEIVQQKEFQVLEWSGIMYPHTVGNITIPPVHFDYTEPQSSALQNQWGNFMHLLSGFATQKQQSTKATGLHVRALPPTTEHVCGVGTLSCVTLTCSSDVVTQGESVVCTVQIEGNAHMSAVQLPSLHLPDNAQVYESQVAHAGTYPNFTKKYEYIVQALEAGTLHIPAQRYVFFDPQSERYVTWATQQRTLRVIPAQSIQQVDHEQQDVIPPAEEISTKTKGTEVATRPLWGDTPLALPWFLIFLLLPILWLLTQQHIYRWYAHIQNYKKRKRIVRMTRHNLEQAVTLHDAHAFLRAWRTFVHELQPAHYLNTEGIVALQRLHDEMETAVFFTADKQHMRTLLQQAQQIIAHYEAAWRTTKKRGKL